MGSGLRGSGLFLHPNSLKVGALRNLIYKFLRVCTPAPENKQVTSKKPIEIKNYFQEHARLSDSLGDYVPTSLIITHRVWGRWWCRLSCLKIWGFPKTRGTLLGVPIIRTIVFFNL